MPKRTQYVRIFTNAFDYFWHILYLTQDVLIFVPTQVVIFGTYCTYP